MSDRIFVKPGMFDGQPASIRHPAEQFRRVPVEGCFLPNDTYTRKRIREGGLVKCDPPSAIEAPAPALVPRRARSGDRPADGTGE